nr:hypothetical protein [Tanacetum cinerariifolium]
MNDHQQKPFQPTELVASSRNLLVKENQEKDKIGTKPGKKREAWQSQEKSKAVTVDKERKTEENAKRRAKNA